MLIVFMKLPFLRFHEKGVFFCHIYALLSMHNLILFFNMFLCVWMIYWNIFIKACTCSPQWPFWPRINNVTSIREGKCLKICVDERSLTYKRANYKAVIYLKANFINICILVMLYICHYSVLFANRERFGS